MKKGLITLLLIFTLSFNSYSQGCSDAGFCRLQYHQDSFMRNSITAEITYAFGEENTTIISPSLIYNRMFNKRLSLNNKVVASYISGSFGNIFNIGDFYSTLSYAFPAKNNKIFTVLSGVKIPFTSSNNKIKGQPLPLVYQSSLGTYDFIAGGSIRVKQFDLDLAAQIPVINRNKNSFISDYSPYKGFPTTNNFIRRADGLIRIGYRINSNNKKWALLPNALAIYHFGKDSYEDIFGQRQTINGSEGFTLNLNLQVQYKLSSSRSLNFSIATPVIVREERPDGLTRSLVTSISYQFGW